MRLDPPIAAVRSKNGEEDNPDCDPGMALWSGSCGLSVPFDLHVGKRAHKMTLEPQQGRIVRLKFLSFLYLGQRFLQEFDWSNP